MSDAIDIFTLPVHPAADQFPMLPDEEKRALAADIKANGLLHPLLVVRVRDNGVVHPWTLGDGRNRREGCRIAGIEPAVEYEEFDSEAELLARIWSENGPRRHMSKGAKAMVAACLFPEPTEPTERGRGKKGVVTTRFEGVSKELLSHARTVLALAPDLVPEVKAGQTSLADAYKTAQDRKKARERKEQWGSNSSASSPPISPIGWRTRPTS